MSLDRGSVVEAAISITYHFALDWGGKIAIIRIVTWKGDYGRTATRKDAML